MSSFQSQQRVVCVHPGRVLERNRIYTIAKVFIGRREGDAEDQPWVTLVGKARNAAFEAWRFRPLCARPTEISIFTAMLNGAKERADA